MRLFLSLPARRLYWSGAALLAVGVLILLRLASGPPLDAAKIGRQAQEELQRTASYRLELGIRTIIDGQEAKVSQVQGEYVRPDSFHLYGQSYDYPLELYQLGSRVIFRDPADGQWKEAQGGPNLVTEAVDLSTSPLIDFLAAGNFELKGREKVGGKECYLLEAGLDKVSNEYWQLFFSDFSLEGWVDADTFKVRRIKLTGSNKEQPQDKLEIELLLTDHDSPLTITPPI